MALDAMESDGQRTTTAEEAKWIHHRPFNAPSGVQPLCLGIEPAAAAPAA